MPQNRGSDLCEELRGEAARKGCPVFCPKPRRRVHLCHNADPAGVELLDLLLSKSVEQSPRASSPPFFSGSPPARANNPVVHDPRFGEQGPVCSFMPAHSPVDSPSKSSLGSASWRKGCSPTKFGHKPATVRVEGFDCLGHDHRTQGITAIA